MLTEQAHPYVLMPGDNLAVELNTVAPLSHTHKWPRAYGALTRLASTLNTNDDFVRNLEDLRTRLELFCEASGVHLQKYGRYNNKPSALIQQLRFVDQQIQLGRTDWNYYHPVASAHRREARNCIAQVFGSALMLAAERAGLGEANYEDLRQGVFRLVGGDDEVYQNIPTGQKTPAVIDLAEIGKPMVVSAMHLMGDSEIREYLELVTLFTYKTTSKLITQSLMLHNRISDFVSNETAQQDIIRYMQNFRPRFERRQSMMERRTAPTEFRDGLCAALTDIIMRRLNLHKCTEDPNRIYTYLVKKITPL